jgi:hypothetical protein
MRMVMGRLLMLVWWTPLLCAARRLHAALARARQTLVRAVQTVGRAPIQPEEACTTAMNLRVM